MPETQKKPRLKLSRNLLYWVVPGTIIPTVLFFVITKGVDLGQSEEDAKAAAKAKDERAKVLSARVENPENASMEDAKRALANVEKEKRDALPPPPTATDIEAKSSETHFNKMRDAREVIGKGLSDDERQSVFGVSSADDRKSFVVYTAPSQEGLVSGGVNAAADAMTIEPDDRKPGEAGADAEAQETAAKPFLPSNDDRVGEAEVTTAKRVSGLYWIAPGTIIRAVLLNAVDTRIPGQVTARVTEPVYDSRYGRYLVVPAGTTLVGQYDSAIANGQKRVMMAFSSMVTPAGGVVDLKGVRASDALGRLGIEGELHTYFWRRMGVAALLALESVGMDRLANSQTVLSTNGTTSTTTNTSEAAKIISDAAKQEPWLKPVAPNITIEEGQKISVITVASIEVPPVANKR